MLAGVFIAVPPLHAQSGSGEYTIGIVELQQVMDAYNKRAVEVQKLEQEAKEYQDKFDKLQADFEETVDEFQKAKGTMSEEKRTDRELELDSRRRDIQSQVRQAEALLEGKQRRLKQSLLKDIVKAIETVGNRDNYHLILEADPESRTGVLFYSPTLNMTQKVIDELNK